MLIVTAPYAHADVRISGNSYAQSGSTSLHSVPSSRTLHQEEADWFQLSHYGLNRPSPNARAHALKQARSLRPLVPVPPPAGGGSWTPLGPAPLSTSNCSAYCRNVGNTTGRITAIAINPKNSQEIWLGTADGGVWHTMDGGKDWAPVFDTQQVLSIGSIAVDPNTPSTIYVGTGEANQNIDGYWGAGVFKSTDGGNTWTQLGLSDFDGLSIGRIAVDPDPNHSQTILLAASNPYDYEPQGVSPQPGIWQSTDGGTSWSLVLPTSTSLAGATDVTFDPANPSIDFAAIAQSDANSGVYQSNSAGAIGSWSLETALPNGDVNAQIKRISVAISQDGNAVYVAMADVNDDLLNCDIYVSPDTGATWKTYSVNNMGDMCVDSGGRQWEYELAFGIDPQNNGHAFLGGVDLWETIDGGQDWTNLTNSGGLSPASVHADIHAITPFVSNGAIDYYLGTDSGMWLGAGSGSTTTFTNLNGGGLNITQFYAGSVGPSDTPLFGGAQDNGEDMFTGGTQWQQMDLGDGGDTIVDPANTQYVYDEYTYGQIRKSTDGGQTWNDAMSGIAPRCVNSPYTGCDWKNFIAPYVMWHGNDQTLFAGTDKVYKTTNGAGTWAAISPVLDPHSCVNGIYVTGCPLSALAVAPSNVKYIYAGDDNGLLYFSTNGGSNWSSAGPSGNGEVCDSGGDCSPAGGIVTGIAVSPSSASTIYVTFSNFASGGHHVFKSTTSGSTFTDISKSLPNIPFESVVVDPNNANHVIVGSDVGVFISTDGGTSWSPLGTGLPNVAIDQIFADPNGQNLYVATHGRGMWETVLDPNVYTSAGGGSGNLVSLTEKGALRWTYAGSSAQHYPAYDNGSVFITDFYSTAYQLLALNAKTGAVLWHTTSASGFPTTDNGSLYASGANTYGYSEMLSLNESSGAAVWTYNTDDRAALTQPTVANGMVYFGSSDGYVYALSASTGALVWKSVQLCYTCSIGIEYQPAVDSTQVYVVNGDEQSLVELNAMNGQEGWYDKGSQYPYITTSSPPLASGGMVYFAGDTQTSSNDIVAVSAQTGYLDWYYAMGSTSAATTSTPALSGGILFCGSSDDNVYAVNAGSGALVWKHATGNTAGSAVVADGIVYVGSADTYLYALKASTGAQIWRYSMGSSASPTLPSAVGA